MKKKVLIFLIFSLIAAALIFFLYRFGEKKSAWETLPFAVNEESAGMKSPQAQQLLDRGVPLDVIENYLRSGEIVETGPLVYPVSDGAEKQIVMSCNHPIGGVDSLEWDESGYVVEIHKDGRSAHTDTCTVVFAEFATFKPADLHKTIVLTGLVVQGHYTSNENCAGQGIEWFCTEKKAFTHNREKIEFFVVSPGEQNLLDKAFATTGRKGSAGWFLGIVFAMAMCLMIPLWAVTKFGN
jgi:hypothetical protein